MEVFYQFYFAGDLSALAYFYLQKHKLFSQILISHFSSLLAPGVAIWCGNISHPSEKYWGKSSKNFHFLSLHKNFQLGSSSFVSRLGSISAPFIGRELVFWNSQFLILRQNSRHFKHAGSSQPVGSFSHLWDHSFTRQVDLHIIHRAYTAVLSQWNL